MASNVVGLFGTHAQADRAIRDLIAEGFAPGRISVVTADPAGTIQRELADRSEDSVATGAATGAASGLVIGGLVGLLVGTMSIGLGPAALLLGGPIAGLLGGAGLGLVSGGIIGVFVGLGVSETDAHIYAESVRRGGTVLTVEVSEAERIAAERIMSACGAASVADRRAMYLREGFTFYNPDLPGYTEADVAAENARIQGTSLTTLQTQDSFSAGGENEVSRESLMVPVGMDAVFRQHFAGSEEGVTGLTFEQLRPAYRFGYELGELAAYRNKPWGEVLPEARETWEDRNPGTWEQVAGAVHFGWNCLVAPPTLGAEPAPRPIVGEPKVL